MTKYEKVLFKWYPDIAPQYLHRSLLKQLIKQGKV